jgi:hypothetical protein
VEIDNQFGHARLVVLKPRELCLPAGKSLDLNVTPEPASRLEHFQCYELLAQKSALRYVTLADQFKRSRPAVLAPSRLCLPVRKNDEPFANKRDHLVCYLLKSGVDLSGLRVLLRTQFKPQTVAVTRARLLCVPSLKKRIR